MTSEPPQRPAAEEKAALRRTMRAVRRAVADRPERTHLLVAQVLASEAYRSAHTVLAFVGVGGEPDTTDLLAAVHRDGKRLALPRTTSQGIEAVEVHPGDDLVPASFGIPEPPAGRPPLPPSAIDLVVVPGLAFDHHGHRLGQGGGHYDRLLAVLEPGTPTLGMAFREQLVERIPREPFDRPVALVVTA